MDIRRVQPTYRWQAYDYNEHRRHNTGPIHKEMDQIVAGLVARKKFVSLCTNALLLEKKLHLFEPSPYLFFSVHLDGLREHHDKAVCQKGVFDKAVKAIKAVVRLRSASGRVGSMRRLSGSARAVVAVRRIGASRGRTGRGEASGQP